MQRGWWAFDVVVVVAFVVIGREDHGFASELSDYVRVATPFLVGLAASGVVLRGWNHLQVGTGIALAAGTVVLGMLARRFVWGDGTAFAFILVTTAFLVAGMAGWRLVVRSARRITAGSPPV